jgi:Uma2 family endonuclease
MRHDAKTTTVGQSLGPWYAALVHATVFDSRGDVVRIPTGPQGIDRLERFRAWMRTLGQDGPRAHFSQGEVWIDMSPQDYHRHLSPVAAINARLTLLADELDLGRYHSDGGWLTNEEVGLSTEPDGFLVLWDTFASGAARWTERDGDRGPVELVGRGDMVLEVVSDSSEHKDRVDLRRDYAAVGFSEYWLVDARGAVPVFELLQLERGTYEAVEADADGWFASPVWGRSFRLDRDTDRLGQPRYRLHVR